MRQTQKADLGPVLTGVALLLSPVLLTTNTHCQAAVSGSKGVQVAEVRIQPPANLAYPKDLLIVGKPGEQMKVQMGVRAEVLWRLSKEIYPYNKKQRGLMLKHCLSELGETVRQIEPFFLGKHPVTNAQYLRFVMATKHRFPFHWWRYGAKEKYYKEQAKGVQQRAKEEHAKNKKLSGSGKPGLAALLYWLDNWQVLKFEIPAGEEFVPVVNVSYRDAVAYCAWAGMRPPTEPEWMLAATGGKRSLYPFGQKYSRKALQAFRIGVGLPKTRDCNKLRPVGSLGTGATGPFGHTDLAAQVWEWTMSPNAPQADTKLFEREYDLLRKMVEKYAEKLKDKNFPKLPESPSFKEQTMLAKGGCLFSFAQEKWEEIRHNVRAPVDERQTMEALGFRVAKSMRVAVDMTMSRLRFDFDSGQYLADKQQPDLSRTDGIERYDLDPSGTLINSYHAISITPLNFAMGSKKSLRTEQIKTKSHIRPIMLGVLMTTEKIAQPALEPGIYLVYWRAAGMPKLLKQVLPQAEREFLAKQAEADRVAKEAAKKAAAKKKGKKVAKKKVPKKSPKKDKKDAKKKANRNDEWRAVLKKHGITVEDFKIQDKKDKNFGRIKKGAYKKIKHIYLKNLDGKKYKLQLSDANHLLIRSNAGTWRTALRVKKRLSTQPKVKGKGAEVGVHKTTEKQDGKKTEVEKDLVTLNFGVCPDPADFKKYQAGKPTRLLPFTLKLVLDQKTDAGRAWRTNYPAEKPEKAGQKAAGATGNGK